MLNAPHRHNWPQMITLCSGLATLTDAEREVSIDRALHTSIYWSKLSYTWANIVHAIYAAANLTTAHTLTHTIAPFGLIMKQANRTNWSAQIDSARVMRNIVCSKGRLCGTAVKRHKGRCSESSLGLQIRRSHSGQSRPGAQRSSLMIIH